MLVLSRKTKERIQIGDDITITIIRIKGRTVRVGIDAPMNYRVRREELPEHSDGRESEALSGDELELNNEELPLSNEDYPRGALEVTEPSESRPMAPLQSKMNRIKSDDRGSRRRFPRAENAPWSYQPMHAGTPSRLKLGSACG
jgi:carbon storage regulator